MSDFPPPKVGQMLYRLQTPLSIIQVEVIKVGRKYFTVRDGYERQYHINTRRFVHGGVGGPGPALLESREEFQQLLLRRSILSGLKHTFAEQAAFRTTLTLDQVQRIESIVCEGLRLRKDREWAQYPIGTKAHAGAGVWWTRVAEGWMSQSSTVYTTPGADALGNCIEMPQVNYAWRTVESLLGGEEGA